MIQWGSRSRMHEQCQCFYIDTPLTQPKSNSCDTTVNVVGSRLAVEVRNPPTHQTMPSSSGAHHQWYFDDFGDLKKSRSQFQNEQTEEIEEPQRKLGSLRFRCSGGVPEHCPEVDDEENAVTTERRWFRGGKCWRWGGDGGYDASKDSIAVSDERRTSIGPGCHQPAHGERLATMNARYPFSTCFSLLVLRQAMVGWRAGMDSRRLPAAAVSPPRRIEAKYAEVEIRRSELNSAVFTLRRVDPNTSYMKAA